MSEKQLTTPPAQSQAQSEDGYWQALELEADQEAFPPAEQHAQQEGKKYDIARELMESFEDQAPEPVQQNKTVPLFVPVTMSLGDYLNIQFPVKEPLLGNDPRRAVIRRGDVIMIYAYRGTGKTRFANFLAVCLASGHKCLKWDIGRPEGLKVLYIDGELDGEEQQERWPQAIHAAGADYMLTIKNLAVMNKFIQNKERLPLFNSPEGREFYIKACAGYDIVFIDSIAAFFPRGSRDWDTAAELMNQTLERCRDENGCAQVLIQHEGKSGSQIGSAQNERLLSVSLRLKEIKDDTPCEGSHMMLSFAKKRNLFGRDIDDLDITYIDNVWSWKPADETRKARIIEMAEAGMTQKEISAEEGVSQPYVSKVLKGAGIKVRK